MVYNSYEEIMQYLNDCAVEEINISRRISDIGFAPFDAGKAELKERLKKIKKEFKFYDRFIRSATTFDTDLLASFLSEYLSKHTDSRFLVCKSEKSESCGRSYAHYDLKYICSATDVMKLQIGDINVDSRIDFDTIQRNLDDRYIVLIEENSYSLMGCNGLCDSFESFPELLEVGKKLVDLKIAYPMMSDEERLATVYGNTKSNCRLNWQAKSFRKRFPNGKRISDMSLSEVYSSKR